MIHTLNLNFLHHQYLDFRLPYPPLLALDSFWQSFECTPFDQSRLRHTRQKLSDRTCHVPFGKFFFSFRVRWFLIRYKRSTARFSNVADNSSQSSSVTLPQGRISFIISFFILFDCSMGWQDLISMRFTQDLISMRSWRATQAPAMNRGAWEFNLMSVHIY